jgi:hypothetical protein
VPGIFLRVAEDVQGPTRDRPPGPAFGLGHVMPSQLLLPLLLEVTRLAVFPFFLRAVGQNLKVPGLAVQGLALGVGTVVLFAGALAWDVLAVLYEATRTRPSFWGPDGAGFPGLMLLVNLAAPLAVILWGVVVLQSARSAIWSKLRYL